MQQELAVTSVTRALAREDMRVGRGTEPSPSNALSIGDHPSPSHATFSPACAATCPATVVRTGFGSRIRPLWDNSGPSSARSCAGRRLQVGHRNGSLCMASLLSVGQRSIDQSDQPGGIGIVQLS